MTRCIAVVGILVAGVFGGGTRAHAQDLDDLSLEIVQVASETGVSPVALHGAVNSTGLRPRAYLISVGELEPPAPPPKPRDWIDTLLECLAWHESRNNPAAVNRSSNASGWLQFLPSTFRQTPPGRAGASIFDLSAQKQAGRWMIEQGRLKEWVTWRRCA